MRRVGPLIGSLAMLVAIAGCTTPAATEDDTAVPSAPAPELAPPAASSGAVPSAPSDPRRRVEGAVVRFTSADTTVDVTIGADSTAVRDFLSLLPLTLSVEEFGGREKIAYLPRKLNTTGTAGADPEDGDLIYFVPWGNLGFYYNAAGIGHSDDVIHLGRYTATAQQLQQLEDGEVTVERVE